MSKIHSIGPFTLISSLFFGAAVLMGCMPDTSAPELPDTGQATTPTAAVSADTINLPVEFAAEPFVDVECLACHQDEEQLKELAVEEEAPESLSEGPG
jgi:hypothetical protein